MVIIIVVVVVAAVLLLAGAIYWLTHMMRQKESADLNRYLQGKDCQWEQMDRAPASGEASNGLTYLLNHTPEAQGIEMRVYEYAEPADGSASDNEGVCLSIVDLSNRTGMILNGFALYLEAMQFGDTLWNDRFLGDTGIMERMITEKRADWDQMQQEIIVGHYALFM